MDLGIKLNLLRPNPLGIAKACAKPKINVYKPVTDGYTRPLYIIPKKPYELQEKMEINT